MESRLQEACEINHGRPRRNAIDCYKPRLANKNCMGSTTCKLPKLYVLFFAMLCRHYYAVLSLNHGMGQPDEEDFDPHLFVPTYPNVEEGDESDINDGHQLHIQDFVIADAQCLLYLWFAKKHFQNNNIKNVDAHSFDRT